MATQNVTAASGKGKSPAPGKKAATNKPAKAAGKSAAKDAAKAPAGKAAKASTPPKGKAVKQPPLSPKGVKKTAEASAAKEAAVSKAKALAPQLAARIGSTPSTKYRGNPDIFGRLVEDHDRHRALLAMIGETEPKSENRALLFAELTRELKSHAAAEEQALWSTVMRNPETTDDARHAVSEHKEIDDMLADLAARDLTSAGWLRRFAALKEEYLHHIGEEEQEQFVAAEKHLSAADTRYMRKVFEQRKKAEKSSAKIEKKIKLKD